MSAMRHLLAFALIALTVSLAACKKEEESATPGVLDGVTKDVEGEIKGADETLDKTGEDIEGAGDDIKEAVSSDDDAAPEATSDAAAG